MGKQEPFSVFKYWALELVRERLSNVSVCQELNLVEQYEMGIRAFDIRVAWFNGELRFAHTFLGPRVYKWIDRLRLAHKEAKDPLPIYIKLRWDWANRDVTPRGDHALQKLNTWLQSCPEIQVSADYWWDSPDHFSTIPRTKLKYVRNWYDNPATSPRWLSWDLTPDTRWVAEAVVHGGTLRDLADGSHPLMEKHHEKYPCEVITIDFATPKFVRLMEEASAQFS